MSGFSVKTSSKTLLSTNVPLPNSPASQGQDLVRRQLDVASVNPRPLICLIVFSIVAPLAISSAAVVTTSSSLVSVKHAR